MKTKKIIVATIFCFFLLSTMANAKSFTYFNPQSYYSFLVPVGWTEISKTTIDETMQKMADQTGGRFINYTAGFQLDNTADFQYPYILVQEYKINTPSHNQIIKTFENDKFSENVNKTTDKYSELMTNASLQNPFIDKERNIIFMNIEMDVVNVGKVKGLMAIFLGKESVTYLNFYSIESEYSENLLIFNQIIDSFKYEQEYEYNKEEAEKNDAPNIFEGAAEKGVIGAIIGGLFALIFGFSLHSKKKKKGE